MPAAIERAEERLVGSSFLANVTLACRTLFSRFVLFAPSLLESRGFNPAHLEKVAGSARASILVAARDRQAVAATAVER